MSATTTRNIGILAMDIYFPSTFVSQQDLELYDGVSEGKYTKGLGQTNMSYCGDREDIVSMCMNALKQLMEKYNIDYNSIGRLEVGTETIIDKSKSIKTALMSLFQESGNFNVEGVDTYNACYGGTSAMFNSVQWMESSYWDGRNAIVITGDIAVYAKGNARPTGGCGVVAMLIGPNAPLVMECGLRGVHMENAYDFYKPDLKSEYPYVDGKLSIECYLRALDRCYSLYKRSFESKYVGCAPFSLESADYCVFHSPYNRLVQKSLGRMAYLDYILSGSPEERVKSCYRSFFAEFDGIGLTNESYGNPKLDTASLKASENEYKAKVLPSTTLAKELGNCYSGSVYASILSLLTNVQNLNGKRVLVFSYGSGLASTLFSFVGNYNNNNNNNNDSGKTTSSIVEKCNINERLQQRIKQTPEEFEKAMEMREESCKKQISQGTIYNPIDSIKFISKGSYYLDKIDDKLIRYYQQQQQQSSL
ncbi:3-hydroxy-3-methylglutaryl-coenzyme A synthase 2 [Cavenderia fasciculata]|uniref:Hydroxymethylglutaryl-CoA synthase n=1 Tax=Cavenderia fasciculata TaxID=261658 RepID=F4PYV2_CACFS|nr:3-hydroxy-3-methylglutaryl-coenzyme A synthase 2 [Cavenderia fasciculata]EGG18981.1 3-hydroxy-3-methylglutaryl-coenzyme A synthase 2 [Cavenderia fasciculata]|eukprot:XP_004357460.1 3-hydroxy-3-methylglutaryl-coenzyme A synthase 2 [Cavenderia fasciculata]